MRRSAGCCSRPSRRSRSRSRSPCRPSSSHAPRTPTGSAARTSNAPASTPSSPAAATSPSTRTTGSSPTRSRPTGNDALRALQAAQDEYEKATAAAQAALDDRRKAQIRQLATDFPALWADPATPARERKRIARLLIEDVTLNRTDQIHLHVRFRGGQTHSLTLPPPLNSWQARQTDPDTIALIDRLLDDHTDAETADQLNAAGRRSGMDKPFTARIVLGLRRRCDFPSHAERLRARGLLTLDEIATQLGVHTSTIKAWHHAGLLRSRKANDKNERLFEPPIPGDPRLVKRLGWRLNKREPIQPSPGGAL
jgi:MerR HTH family regulatory protein